MSEPQVVGRFAPSPSGRMHLGNIYTAVMSWASVRSRSGRWVLRIEDLDPQRSKLEYARQIEDDLRWLGLDWDEGGLADIGPHGPYSQSRRHEIYEVALSSLLSTGLVYPCTCTRAEIHTSSAPHASDGRVIYSGHCRPAHLPYNSSLITPQSSLRLAVGNRIEQFVDLIQGPQSVDLAREFGDFVLRRADGAWAYQLAVVVDDALMGITEVMRGDDLLLSTGPQLYLYHLLGYIPPRFAHLPLICNEAGQRLSKRDGALSMEALRATHTPAQLLGRIAHLARLQPAPIPLTPIQLLTLYPTNSN